MDFFNQSMSVLQLMNSWRHFVSLGPISLRISQASINDLLKSLILESESVPCTYKKD